MMLVLFMMVLVVFVMMVMGVAARDLRELIFIQFLEDDVLLSGCFFKDRKHGISFSY